MRIMICIFGLLLTAAIVEASVVMGWYHGEYLEGRIQVTWMTESETNNAFFRIEAYQHLMDTVAGHGTTDTPSNYSRLLEQLIGPIPVLYLVAVDSEGVRQRFGPVNLPGVPVDVVGFTAAGSSDSVRLSASVGQEDTMVIRADMHYHVTRRIEGTEDDSTILYFEPLGPSHMPHLYTMTDSRPAPGTLYHYCLWISWYFDLDGQTWMVGEDTAYVPELRVADPVSLIPRDIQLGAFPNPFNPTTTLSFTLPYEGRSQIVIHDLLGRDVQTLANERYSTGEHRIAFDGSSLPSGIYFARLQSGEFTATQKLLLLK